MAESRRTSQETIDPSPAAAAAAVADLATPARGRSNRLAKSVNLRDVAAAAKVSVATVSMVLNNNPRISRATHTRVQRVMERLGYQPNRLAQSLSSNYTHVLAVLIPALRHAFADAYFGELLSGISDRSSRLGYKLMLEQAKPEFISGRKHLELFDRRYVDGILCLGTENTYTWLGDFERGTYPALIVDNRLDTMPCDSVVCDYASGAKQVLNYLLQLGHTQIGLITAGWEISTSQSVRERYRAMLGEAGITIQETWIAEGGFSEEGGAAAAKTLMQTHPELTAIMCGNDKMAIGALLQLDRLGIKVPSEVSITGFDDLRHAAFVKPALTTVHLPLYQVGALAVDRLVDRIHGRVASVSETLATHLVVRDSTALARSVTRSDPASAE